MQGMYPRIHFTLTLWDCKRLQKLHLRWMCSVCKGVFSGHKCNKPDWTREVVFSWLGSYQQHQNTMSWSIFPQLVNSVISFVYSDGTLGCFFPHNLRLRGSGKGVEMILPWNRVMLKETYLSVCVYVLWICNTFIETELTRQADNSSYIYAKLNRINVKWDIFFCGQVKIKNRQKSLNTSLCCSKVFRWFCSFMCCLVTALGGTTAQLLYFWGGMSLYFAECTVC